MGTTPGRATESALDRASALLHQGKHEEAEATALQAIGDEPDFAARAWFLVGAARHRLQRPEAALAAMLHALSFDPAQDEALRACAILYLELKRPREALPLAEDLCRRHPGDISTIVDAGIILEEVGDLPAALARYDAALRLSPRDYRARLNRGALLSRLGRLKDALLDNQTLVRSHVGSAAAHYNLADVLLRLDRYADALAAVERALRLAPATAEYHMLRGLVLAMLERDAEASASFMRAHELNPEGARRYRAAAASTVGLAKEDGLTRDPRQIRLARLLERQKTCDWGERDRLIRGMRELAGDIRRASSPIEEMGLYHTALSLPLSAGEQQALAQGISSALKIRLGDRPPATFASRRGNRIRLGFLSPNFREHPSAQQHGRHFALRDRSCFEVFAYSLHQGEGELRKRIVESCDEFREVSELGDREIAACIAYDGIDILVDLAGHMDFSRPEVLALRPAPLRVSYMGLPATMGRELIDYRITDHFTTTHEEIAWWSEKLVFLPDTLWIYNDLEVIDSKTPSRIECGLPERGFVFCCFNTAYKIEPDVFSVWMHLLLRVPGSVLWLLEAGPETSRNLLREAAARGVGQERLVFAPRLPRAAHLARHVCADLFLDTFYCGAHTTTADALWGGLPVLNWAGNTMASRIGASIVRAAGLPELIASDHVSYEDAAFRLATHPDELGALRERLARMRESGTLFDTSHRVRELDQAFLMMWERHAAGLSPESFAVPPLDGPAR
ncbi:MAG: tetratricopeptide repeat protein [Denitratisoma sp.]|nr:tetratricopeptide repeat protein [Denitratisoma sp.]